MTVKSSTGNSINANQLTEKTMTDNVQASSASQLQAVNPGFENWDKASPSNWLIRDHHTVKKSSDASEGKLSLEIPSTVKDLNYVYQYLPINSSVAGKKIIVTAMAKSFDAGNTVIWGYSITNKVQSASFRGAAHPGDGKWHRIGVSIPLPENVTDGKICYALETSLSAKPALFDDVKIYIK